MRAPPSPVPKAAALPPGENDEMDIHSIGLGDRAGRDLGNLGPLMASIAAEGLRHPITVGPGGRLILGRRRLEACIRLGQRSIGAITVTTVQEALDQIRRDAEGAQYVHPLTIPEIVCMDFAVRELRWWERDGSTIPEGHRGRRDGRREMIASHYGLNGRQYSIARELVLAARGYRDHRGTRAALPADARALARAALDIVKEPGDLQAALRLYRTGASEYPPAPSHGPRRLPTRSQEHSVGSALASLSGIATGLAGTCPLDPAIPPDVLQRWDQRLGTVISELGRFRREVRRHGNRDND